MELLVGCGNDRAKKVTFPAIQKDWSQLVTLDIDSGVQPDVVHNLNVLPYPFESDAFDEIHAYEVLEHCGRQGDWRFFFDQFAEFHRILKPGGYFIATTPLWDGKWAWGDPGHTRVINDGTIAFLSQQQYRDQVGKTAMTDYRRWYSADFDVVTLSEKGGFFAFVLKARK